MDTLKPKTKIIAIAIVLGIVFMSLSLVNDREVSLEAPLVNGEVDLNESSVFSSAMECLDRINVEQTQIDYEFVVVGHGYGSPTGKNLGLDERLLSTLPLEKPNLIVLTGDIVRSANKESLETVKRQINQFQRVLIAPGNHDVSSEFDKTFDSIHNYIVELGPDLLFALNSNEINFGLNEDVVSDFKSALNLKDAWRNIFIFSHHVSWANTITELTHSNAPQPDSTLENLRNILQSVNKRRVYFIAGDVGAFPGKSGLLCRGNKEEVFIASGLGRSDTSNYLVFKVVGSGGAEIKVKSLPKFIELSTVN